MDYDVDPYIDFGSGKGETTSSENRCDVPTGGITSSEVVFGELPSIIGIEGSIANDVTQEVVDNALESFEQEKIMNNFLLFLLAIFIIYLFLFLLVFKYKSYLKIKNLYKKFIIFLIISILLLISFISYSFYSIFMMGMGV